MMPNRIFPLGDYPDGLAQTCSNLDPEEEPHRQSSQRWALIKDFRKFKIIKFRWIKEQDV